MIADAMLVTLEDTSYANMTIPWKVQSYMAAGKPVIGAVNGSCASFIKNNKVGYACNACDSKSLANLLNTLDISKLNEIGKYAREVYFIKYLKNNSFPLFAKS